jgi:signal-transduction protein with cAMP-binding, CBS, and nucleotidyltransferase domain
MWMRDIAGIISSEVCSLTARAAAIAEREVSVAFPRPRALRFAVMVLGSAGRGESLLALDQDNAIIFDATDQPAAEAWLMKFGERMNAILDEVGVPFCKGGVMAGNRGCKSAVQWRKQVAHCCPGRAAGHPECRHILMLAGSWRSGLVNDLRADDEAASDNRACNSCP